MNFLSRKLPDRVQLDIKEETVLFLLNLFYLYTKQNTRKNSVAKLAEALENRQYLVFH